MTIPNNKHHQWQLACRKRFDQGKQPCSDQEQSMHNEWKSQQAKKFEKMKLEQELLQQQQPQE